MIVAIATLAFLVAVGLVIYVVREATVLKIAAKDLKDQLTQFKEGGFDQLVKEKLETFTSTALKELQSREEFIRQNRTELIEQQSKATKAAQEFKEDLGAVTTRIENLKNLQSQVGELNDLLKPQQLRGELGEVIVRTLISDKLPKEQYEEDFVFSNGKKVEFVIKLSGHLIPIDSKLQLEDYKRMRETADERQRQTLRTEFKRTVKQKIDEVREYIQPTENTYPFALMVIPSEAVYYDIIGNKDFLESGGLYEYAKSNDVFLVSPLTFWAYLTTIAQGLRGLEIEQRAGEILSGLQSLAKNIRGFSQNEFRVLGDHLRNATTKYDEAKDRVRDFEDDLSTLERMDTSTHQQEGAVA